MTITDAHSGVPRQEEMSQPVEAGNLEVQDRKQGSLSQVLRNMTTGAGGWGGGIGKCRKELGTASSRQGRPTRTRGSHRTQERKEPERKAMAETEKVRRAWNHIC